jgi:dCMP deaminase
MSVERPTWDETFFRVANVMSARATCPRRSVGAVIVNHSQQILTTGYNGSPRGLAHCTDVGCQMVEGHCVRAVHAEANAILQAARVGVSLDGATLYTTCKPCTRCALLIVQAGIVEVVYLAGSEERADKTGILEHTARVREWSHDR